MMFGKRDDEDAALFLIRWTARVLSLAIIFLLSLFLFGNDGITLEMTATEWTGLAFFPLGVAVGFLIGWKNELIGGLVSVASLAGFYFVFGLAMTGRLPRGGWFAIFTLPGFLFLAYGLLRLRVFRGHGETTLVR
jgi:hypothetical protein